MAELGVDLVGEVDGSHAAGEREDLALGREDVDLLRVEVDLQAGQEGARVLDLLLPLQELAQPEDVRIALLGVVRALLVVPVGGDPLLGHQVHLPGADLHLEGLPALAHHRRVERLVEVGLGHGDVVLEPARDRAPALVDHAQGGVGVFEVARDDAEGQVVVELGDVDALAAQLLVDRVVALDPVADLGLDRRLIEGLDQAAADPLDGPLAHLHLLRDLRVELGVLVRVEVVEGQVLEVALDPRHPEAVGDGGVDLQRLARDAPARLGRQVLEGLHVVQPVGELDQDHPDVLGRGEDHLAEGLGLDVVPAHVLVAGQLGDPVDQLGDLGAEALLESVAGGEGVLEDVVEQPDGDADLVELEVGQQVGDRQGVGQVRLARASRLVLVHLGGEDVDLAQEVFVVAPPAGVEALQDVVEAYDPGGGNGRCGQLLTRWGHHPTGRREGADEPVDGLYRK